MKIRDLFNISLHNLMRHKSRTILTVLGVIIGCCSVVIMISFGIAMKISQEHMLSEMGDLRVINIYNNGNGSKLTDNEITGMESIQNIVCISPKMYLEIPSSAAAGENGRYKAQWPSVAGVKKDAINDFNYEFTEGGGFTGIKQGDTIEALAGEYFAYSLRDSQRPEGYNYIDYWSYLYSDDDNADKDSEEMPKPYVDPMDTTIELTLGDPENPTEKTLVKRLKIVGILKEDYSKGYETSEGLILEANELKALVKEYNRLNGIAQKNNESYSQAQAMVNDIENVAECEKQIQQLGYSTDSLESVREPLEKDVRQKQLMFAGLGIVSLFVAALGIMNTMFMAISERKKEIGIMKALGCPLAAVRIMFLTEAGLIGLIGGIIGCVISFVISGAINIVSAGGSFSDPLAIAEILFLSPDRVSVIPVWLGLCSVVFSVFIGILSGYWPAERAVGISVLDAIRSE